MLERWNLVFRAKWFCWKEIGPGEAFRRGSRKKFGQKTVEIDCICEKFRRKNVNFSTCDHPISFKLTVCTALTVCCRFGSWKILLRALSEEIMSHFWSKSENFVILGSVFFIYLVSQWNQEKMTSYTFSLLANWGPHANFQENRTGQFWDRLRFGPFAGSIFSPGRRRTLPAPQG